MEGSLLRAAGTCLSCHHLPPALRGDGPKLPLPDHPLSCRTPLVAASSSAVLPPVPRVDSGVTAWREQPAVGQRLLGEREVAKGSRSAWAGWLQPGERAWVLRLPLRPDVFTVRKHGARRRVIPCREIEKRSAARKGVPSSSAPRTPAWCALTRARPQK